MSMSRSAKCQANVIIIIMLFFLSAVYVHADDTARRATPEEQDFYRSTQDLLAAALPGDTPDGWEITGQTETSGLEIVAENIHTRPMVVEYHLEWTNASLKQQVQDAAIAEISKVSANPPISDAQILEYEMLAEKVAEAAAAGNVMVVQILKREMEQKAAIINTAFAAMDEKIAEINRSEAATDTYAAIYLMANNLYQRLDPEAEQVIVAGFPAFRTKGYRSSSNDWREGATIIFMGGNWFVPAGKSAYQFAKDESVPHTKLQSIVVWIEADPKRAASIVEMIDWQALQTAIEQ